MHFPFKRCSAELVGARAHAPGSHNNILLRPVQPRILSEGHERVPPWQTINGGAEGGMDDDGWENARDRLPAVPNKETIMAAFRPNDRQWTRRNIITRPRCSMGFLPPSLSTTTFPSTSPPGRRSTVSLPFPKNVCTRALSTSSLRLRDVDFPQAIS